MKKPLLKKKVLIADSGIAGLSAAHQVLNKGYEVAIFEANKFLGGELQNKRTLDIGGAELELPMEIRFYQKSLLQNICSGIKTSPLEGILILDPDHKKGFPQPLTEAHHLLESQLLFTSDFWDYWQPILKLRETGSPQLMPARQALGLKGLLSLIQTGELVFIQNSSSSLHEEIQKNLKGAEIKTKAPVFEIQSHSITWESHEQKDQKTHSQKVLEKGSATICTNQVLEIEPEKALQKAPEWFFYTHTFKVKNLNSQAFNNFLIIPKKPHFHIKQMVLWDSFFGQAQNPMKDSLLSVTLFRQNQTCQTLETEIKNLFASFAAGEPIEVEWIHSHLGRRAERHLKNQALSSDSQKILFKDLEGAVFTASVNSNPSDWDLYESGAAAAQYTIENILEYELNNYEKKQSFIEKRITPDSEMNASTPACKPQEPKTSSPQLSPRAVVRPLFSEADSAAPILSIGFSNQSFSNSEMLFKAT